MTDERIIRRQAYKDWGNVSKGRVFMNKSLLPRMAFSCPDGSDVLFVGVHRYWDYASLWNNPAKLCNFYTLDTNPGSETDNPNEESFYPKPDYCMSIENCDELEDNRFQQIIMIGVFEYLDHFDDKALPQIIRMLKPGGVAIFGFEGKGDYDDNRGMGADEVVERLKPLQTEEIHLTYEKDGGLPNAVLVVARKL